MRTFRDTEGRDWQVTVNVRTVKEVRSALGVDLADAVTVAKDGTVRADLVERIAGDPCLLADILWVICREDAKGRGVSDVGFGRALAGDVIERATEALLDELVDFFPGAKRLFLRKAVEVARRYAGESAKALETALASPEFDARLKDALNSATSSPASSGPTPVPSPSASS